MKTEPRRKRPKRKLPTAGWVVVQVCDLNHTENPFHPEEVRCERCGQALRYAHVLEHDDWHNLITVGRCCAERLSTDYDAHEAERELSNRATRRKRFPTLDGWRLSSKGNPYIEYHGATITVFPKAGGYTFCVFIEDSHFPQEEYPTIKAAKLTAWDVWYELAHT